MAQILDYPVWFVRFPHHPAELLGEEGEGVEPLVSNNFALLEAIGLERHIWLGNDLGVRDSDLPEHRDHGWSGRVGTTLGEPEDYLIHEDFRNNGKGPEPYYFFFANENDARAWVRTWELSKGLKGSQLRPGMAELSNRTEQLIRLFQHIRLLPNPAQAVVSVLVLEEGEESVFLTLMSEAAAIKLLRDNVTNVP